MKVLLKRLRLNGHTVGFHPQAQKLEEHTKFIVQYESTAEEVSLEWSHHRISCPDSEVRILFMSLPSRFLLKVQE